MPLPDSLECVNVALLDVRNGRYYGPFLALVSYRRSNEVLDLVTLVHGMADNIAPYGYVVAEKIRPETFDGQGLPNNLEPGENWPCRWWPA
jgi:hypothetical protein